MLWYFSKQLWVSVFLYTLPTKLTAAKWISKLIVAGATASCRPWRSLDSMETFKERGVSKLQSGRYSHWQKMAKYVQVLFIYSVNTTFAPLVFWSAIIVDSAISNTGWNMTLFVHLLFIMYTWEQVPVTGSPDALHFPGRLCAWWRTQQYSKYNVYMEPI